MTTAHRYWVRSPDGRVAYGFEREQAAISVALEYGVGAALIDTLAQAYVPMLQIVERCDGELRLTLGPVGGVGRSALHWAASRGEASVVELLLNQGADIAAVDASGRSALAVAEARGKKDAAGLLRSRGAR